MIEIIDRIRKRNSHLLFIQHFLHELQPEVAVTSLAPSKTDTQVELMIRQSR
ncbi:unnamed protein product, partial [Amoebophrya sp. A120]|eukprot:GSA120T00022463001.1